jgi:hypothetical protein
MSLRELHLNPNEQTNLRYRLFARAIRINGLSQMKELQPYLEARMRKTFQEMIYPQILTDGSRCSHDSLKQC